MGPYEMPFKDPEKRRQYKRAWKKTRLSRKTKGSPGGSPANPGTLDWDPTLAEFRLRTAQNVLELLDEQINAVRIDPLLGTKTLEKARCVGYLASVALRAVETGQLEDRIAALEGRGRQDEELRALESAIDEQGTESETNEGGGGI